MQNLDGVRRIAENRIREALDEGQFDNLPGMGKPIRLLDDSLVPPAQRAAVKLLKNAGVLPEWAQLQQEIAREQQLILALPAQRAKAAASYILTLRGTFSERSYRYDEWRQYERSQFAARLKACNHMVLKLCMVGPQHFVTAHPLNTHQMLEEFDELVPTDLNSAHIAAKIPTPAHNTGGHHTGIIALTWARLRSILGGSK